MKKKYVEELKWLEEDEMPDVMAITRSVPGPLSVNASVITGYRIAGIAGSLTVVLETILLPMVIISIISLFYEQFRSNPYIAMELQVMRAGVAAVIFAISLFILRKYKVSAVYIILGSGVVGTAVYSILGAV